jgi:ubiquinone/menaquinone biosynthesis C-methylase UbiE
MAFDELMGLTNRLLANAIALSAVAARLGLDESGAEGDPAVRAQLDRVIAELGIVDQLAQVGPGERSVLRSFSRSYLAQALDLIDDPARPGAWQHDDPVLLQAQGAASSVVASLLVELGLAGPGARILDVGTGVGGIARAFCELIPDATVVGVDPWKPALAIARDSVAAAGLDSRITLVEAPIQDFWDEDGFDLAWLPSFFIPDAVIDEAIGCIHRLLRPGGSIVVGVTFASEDSSLEAVTDDLMTVRSGGSVLTPEDATARLEQAGFEDAREIERTWNPPLRFVVGRRA